MKCSGRKCLININGLPKPWVAYMHLIRKKIFYHNTKTGESLWELPAEVGAVCSANVGDLSGKMANMCSTQRADLCDTDVMDCSELDQALVKSGVATASLSTLDECEEMDIDFTEDFRHMRRIQYGQDVIDLNLRSEQLFASSETSRDCVVFDTCSLIEDPNFIRDCIAKNVCIAIPYRVLYELDKLKKTSSRSIPAKQLVQKASRVIHVLRSLKGSPLIYWENSAESFEEVDGFVTNSMESTNDDYILKCAYRIKSLLDSRGEGWETVFITNDQLLLLKSHANKIPCKSVKEAKQILRNSVSSPSTMSCDQSNVTLPSQNIRSPSSGSTSKKTRIRKEKSADQPAHHSSPTKHGKKEKCKEKIGDNEGSVMTYSKIWKLLLKTMQRCETYPTKRENDVTRLRECASIFCANPTEENLSTLAQMTFWLYSYYLPRRNERRNTNHKVLMKNGFHKELCSSSRESQKLMKELREFSYKPKPNP